MEEPVYLIIRSLVLFFLVWFSVRLIGKRSISKVKPFNLMSYIVLAIVTTLMSLNLIALVPGFIVLLTWLVLPLALDLLAIKSEVIHQLINGKENVLIKHGKIMEENLLQVRMTGEDLLAELRSKNIFNLTDVEFAVMETNGEINAYLKSDQKPVTAHDLGQKVAPQAEPQTVIMDGNILNEPLFSLGLNQEWLKVELEKMGVAQENVFLGQVDSSGDLFLDLFDDAVEIPKPKVKELLYANLQKVQADLSTFSLQTENKNAKSMYLKNSQKIENLLDKLRPYLLN
ncbi:DUF421 domain-containing protein [Desulfosporosinus sp. BICA1-9]|uniref:DUF421 domain-containing protein n=1 Tax=Desulfosporosinus sp. BICA1-9 TaxID=1531958 RepID=UPI00054C7B62|nr:DUF421 domain-containing protein [Desulfosporosinus sp. BICA1-9]KJS48959.1 MAG: hypothetical protein VR66_11295 [Peptococcaceae bacterium BRH_c23]KJS84039.1 MAG: hypothetical protein JL57_21620 [Desulfosporosinus sp. BICA1-9]HBW33888.1 DUF421 domain-containing protein [Desulfosporosinus sp.]